jgi:raffinose/stachyose/melibiose transport system substrate-binding protein
MEVREDWSMEIPNRAFSLDKIFQLTLARSRGGTVMGNRFEHRICRVLLPAVMMLLVAGGIAFANGSKETSTASAPVAVSMVEFFTPTPSDGQSYAFAAMLEKFKKDYPNIALTTQFVDHDSYEGVTLAKDMATDSVPDIFVTKRDFFTLLQSKNRIMPINKILDADPQFASHYLKGVLTDFTTTDGKVWAFPFQAYPNSVIYYNSDVFSKAGINQFPSTLQGLIDAVKQLKSAGFIPIASGDKGLYPIPSLLLNGMVYRYGDVKWFNSVFYRQGGSFMDPTFLNAAKDLQTLVSEQAFNSDLTSLSEQQEYELYFKGNVGMIVSGGWAVSPIVANAPDSVLKATKVAIFPVVPGMEQYANVVPGGAGWGMAINPQRGQQVVDAATTTIKAIFGVDFANESARHSGAPAMVPTIDLSALPQLYRDYLALKYTYSPVIDVWFPAQFGNVYYKSAQDLAIGSITAEQYAQQLDTTWKSMAPSK